MWESIFDREFSKDDGASAEILEEFAREWNKALTIAEIQEVSSRQKNPFPVYSPLHDQYQPLDASTWSFPQKPLPNCYLELLAYANGGGFETGERSFQFFGTEDLREMNLVYEVLHYMPGAVSFAMDGGGNHYLFDMRAEPVDGEYPIVLVGSGNLDYEDCILAANSFYELCSNGEALQE